MTEIKKQIDDLAKNKKHSEALVLAKKWVNDEKQNAQAWSSLAYIHQLLKEIDNAEEAIQQSINLAPKQPAFLFEFGHILFRNKKTIEAQEAFKQCVDLSKELNWDYYLDSAILSQAQCLNLTGQKEQAKKLALEVKPTTGAWLGEYINPQSILGQD